ncbi:hypothetical protein CEXT_353481 [Caerostris extrusa]|uniref:Uncharacterized protein n=1 Tax=Caerostris extrusa TaxID=172846 RepID=A0AAV4QS58_CAEEX|nr:hypothetical protein CEXT_353481 [Caerostris extrusa]
MVGRRIWLVLMVEDKEHRRVSPFEKVVGWVGAEETEDGRIKTKTRGAISARYPVIRHCVSPFEKVVGGWGWKKREDGRIKTKTRGAISARYPVIRFFKSSELLHTDPLRRVSPLEKVVGVGGRKRQRTEKIKKRTRGAISARYPVIRFFKSSELLHTNPLYKIRKRLGFDGDRLLLLLQRNFFARIKGRCTQSLLMLTLKDNCIGAALLCPAPREAYEGFYSFPIMPSKENCLCALLSGKDPEPVREIKIRGGRIRRGGVGIDGSCDFVFSHAKERGFTRFLIINYEWVDLLRAIQDTQVEHDWRRPETEQMEFRTD